MTKQKLQFVVTGFTGWLLGLVVMKALIGYEGWSVKSGTAAMLVITFAYTFTINRYYTWRSRQIDRLCLVKFVTSRLATAYGTWVAVAWLVTLQWAPLGLDLSVNYLMANTLCVAVATILNWTACDRWVFTPWLVPPRLRAAVQLFGRPRGRHATAEWRPVWPRYAFRITHWADYILRFGRYLLVQVLVGLGIADPSPSARRVPVDQAESAAQPPHEGPIAPLEPLPPVRRLPQFTVKVAKWLLLGGVLGAITVGAMQDIRETLVVVIAIWTLVLVAQSMRSLLRTVYRWRTPWTANFDRNRLSDQDFAPPKTRFDFYVPARDEPILLKNLRNIMKLAERYPKELFRIFVILAEDDPKTHELALIAQAEVPETIEILIVEGSRKKPVSLNGVLRRIEGLHEWQITLDAESDPSPLLLCYLNTLIQRNPEVAVWQLPVHLMNITGRSRRRPDGSKYPRWHPQQWGRILDWWQGHNALEYAVWFQSVQDHQADRGYLTFGGNTIAIRTDILKAVGGWPEMLTEDAALGMKISRLLDRYGLRIRTYYLPELATKEQTPMSWRGWLHQRVRWLQGFMEVKQMGDWKRLPTWKQRVLAWETLTMPAFQAVAGVMVPLSVVTIWMFKAPIPIVLLTFVPLIMTGVYAGVLVAVFRNFCRTFGLKAGPLFMTRFVLTMPLYQLALSVAAIMAKLRHLRGVNNWVVTAHDSHLTEEVFFTEQDAEINKEGEPDVVGVGA